MYLKGKRDKGNKKEKGKVNVKYKKRRQEGCISN